MLTLIHRSTGLSIHCLYHHLRPQRPPEENHMSGSDKQRHESTKPLVPCCLHLGIHKPIHFSQIHHKKLVGFKYLSAFSECMSNVLSQLYTR